MSGRDDEWMCGRDDEWASGRVDVSMRYVTLFQ